LAKRPNKNAIRRSLMAAVNAELKGPGKPNDDQTQSAFDAVMGDLGQESEPEEKNSKRRLSREYWGQLLPGHVRMYCAAPKDRSFLTTAGGKGIVLTAWLDVVDRAVDEEPDADVYFVDVPIDSLDFSTGKTFLGQPMPANIITTPDLIRKLKPVYAPPETTPTPSAETFGPPEMYGPQPAMLGETQNDTPTSPSQPNPKQPRQPNRKDPLAPKTLPNRPAQIA